MAALPVEAVGDVAAVADKQNDACGFGYFFESESNPRKQYKHNNHQPVKAPDQFRLVFEGLGFGKT